MSFYTHVRYRDTSQSDEKFLTNFRPTLVNDDELLFIFDTDETDAEEPIIVAVLSKQEIRRVNIEEVRV